MQSLKLNWNVLALVLGLTLGFSSFAFSPKSAKQNNLATAWFATDASGNLISPAVQVDPGSCLGGLDFCAKEYTVDGSGNPDQQTQADPIMRPSE